jgi:hypothetical protein
MKNWYAMIWKDSGALHKLGHIQPKWPNIAIWVDWCGCRQNTLEDLSDASDNPRKPGRTNILNQSPFQVITERGKQMDLETRALAKSGTPDQVRSDESRVCVTVALMLTVASPRCIQGLIISYFSIFMKIRIDIPNFHYKMKP